MWRRCVEIGWNDAVCRKNILRGEIGDGGSVTISLE